MSQYPTTTDGRPIGKERSPWGVLGLALITLGIYFLVWYYKINKEMRAHDERIEVKPGLAVLSLFVPIVSLVSMYNTAKRVQQCQAMDGLEASCSPPLALILAIFTGGIGYPAYMASTLRRHWQIHREGFSGAGYAPYGAIPQGQPAQPPPSPYAPQAAIAQPAVQPVAALPVAYQAPTEQLSPDGKYRWDGQSWQPVTPAAPAPAPAEQLSPDGRYRWDGQAWQPVQPVAAPVAPQPEPQPAAAAPSPVEQLSPDGNYRWDGQAWQPVQRPVPQPEPQQPRAAAAEQTTLPGGGGQLSPDGRYRWDGQAWQPVQP